MSLLDADRFSPILFLGLGGSGCNVVNALAAKLQRHPNFSRFRDLIHFVGIDTNKSDLMAQRQIPEANRFLISSFDRRTYVERKRGRRELPEDTMVTQWVHDNYQFRDTQGAGAGQIRVESRLGLYYNLEEDRARIRGSFQRMLDNATRPDNPYRDSADRVVHVCLYASVAGGTGSGGFLSMAYLLQDLIREHGWGRPNVVGTLMLPSIFMSKVEQPLHADINANGYAALKELEYVTKLGYEGCIQDIEFHYDPVHPERQEISRRPFSMVYLIDKPAELALERYTNAIADSTFLQIFSPILGAQAGEYDNYEKHQKTLALGHFSVHYGTLGAALILFPRKDLLHYSALRYAARGLDKYLVLGQDPNFRVPYDDPKFQRLPRQDQDRLVDDKFAGYVEHQARLEEDRQERGIYCGIRDFKAPDGKTLREAFQSKLLKVFEELDGKIEINPVEMMNIQEQSTSLARSVDGLRKDISASRSRVIGEYLQSMIADLRSDRFFGEFFRANKVDPLTQRFFLTGLHREAFLLPGQADDFNFLRETKENPHDLDSENVAREVARYEKRLQETANRSAIKSLLARENKEFLSAKRAVENFFSQLLTDNRDWLKASFWQKFHEELLKSIETKLTAFRNVASIADEVARQVSAEAQRFQADPAGAQGYDAETAEYYLDLEILRDDRRGERLWGRFFDHTLDKAVNYDESRIFEELNGSFLPVTDDAGRIRVRDAHEIVRDIRQRLYALGKEKFTAVLKEMKLDLPAALQLEARYVATRETPGDAAAIEKVSDEAISAHVRDKFQLAMEQCVLLANIDQTKFDDPTVTPNRISYAGLAGRYSSDEAGSLKSVLRSVASDLQFVPWDEEDMVVFYRAMMGVPVYFFRRVNDELVNHYRAVKSRPNRTYPLHIEKAWEDGLPNLDPKEIREAEERRRKEDAAVQAAQERASRLWNFTFSTFLGTIQKGDAGYEWVLGTARRRLAPDRAAAFEAFVTLDQALRKDLEGKVVQAITERNASAPARRKFRDDLQAHLAGVNDLYYQAISQEQDREKRFLEEEKILLESRLEALPAA